MTHIQTATHTLYRPPPRKLSLQVFMLSITSALPLCSEIQTLKNSSKKCIRPERGGERPWLSRLFKMLIYRVKFPGFFLRPALKGTVCLAEFPLCSPHCVSPRSRDTGSLMMFFSSLLKDYVVIEWSYQRLMLHNTLSELT